MESQFLKRLKSYAWRLGAVSVAGILTFLLSPETLAALAADGYAVPAFITVLGGLALGELTKWLNTKG